MKNTYAVRVKSGHNTQVGQRMRLARKMAGFTLDQVAEFLGYTSRTQVVKLESGRTMIPAATVVMFCEALNIDIKEIMEMRVGNGGKTTLDAEVSTRRQKYNEEVGHRIKVWRRVRKMSLIEMSRRMGYQSDSTMGKLERGEIRITVSMLMEVCEILEVEPNQLMKSTELAPDRPRNPLARPRNTPTTRQ